MSNQTKTVRYNNQKWLIDKESNNLTLEGNPKTKVDIDEVWMSLCDNDQYKIANILSANTEEELALLDLDREDYD